MRFNGQISELNWVAREVLGGMFLWETLTRQKDKKFMELGGCVDKWGEKEKKLTSEGVGGSFMHLNMHSNQQSRRRRKGDL